MIISLTGFMGCGKSSVGRRLSELLGWHFVDLDAVIEEREGRRIPEIFETEGEVVFRRIEKEVLEELLRGCEDRIPGQSLPSMDHSPKTCCRRLFAAKVHRTVCLSLTRVGKCQFHTTASSSRKELHTDTHSCENGDGIVLALGGGAVMQEECEKMVHSETLCIYLRASVETLVERLKGEDSGRPLLKGSCSDMKDLGFGKSGSGPVISSEVKTSALHSRILELMRLRAATYERVAHLIIDTDGKSIDEIAEEITVHLPVCKSSQKNSPIFP